MTDDALWYDGARRERHDVHARIVRDARVTFEQIVTGVEGDDEAWLGLLARLEVPLVVDEPDYSTFNRRYWVRVTDEHVHVGLARQPRKFAMTLEAIAREPWCASARPMGDEIELTVRGLDEPVRVLIERAIDALVANAHAELDASAAAFVAAARADLPDMRVELAASHRRLEVAAQSKKARLAAACVG